MGGVRASPAPVALASLACPSATSRRARVVRVEEESAPLPQEAVFHLQEGGGRAYLAPLPLLVPPPPGAGCDSSLTGFLWGGGFNLRVEAPELVLHSLQGRLDNGQDVGSAGGGEDLRIEPLCSVPFPQHIVFQEWGQRVLAPPPSVFMNPAPAGQLGGVLAIPPVPHRWNFERGGSVLLPCLLTSCRAGWRRKRYAPASAFMSYMRQCCSSCCRIFRRGVAPF